jgi:hypothetical protein
MGTTYGGKNEMSIFHSIAAFFERLFAPKTDDFKALLIADLGIER